MDLPNRHSSGNPPAKQDTLVDALGRFERQFGKLGDEPLTVGECRGLAAADHERANEGGEFVHEIVLEQREDQFATALDQQPVDPPLFEGGEGRSEIDAFAARSDDPCTCRRKRPDPLVGGGLAREQVGRRRVVKDPGVYGSSGTRIRDDAGWMGWVAPILAGGDPLGIVERQVGIVSEHRSDPDHDGVAFGAQSIDAPEIVGTADGDLLAPPVRQLPVGAHRGVDDDVHTGPTEAGENHFRCAVRLFLSGRHQWPMMSVEDRAEELASDLGVDKEEVKEDLENLVAYSVPIDEAVSSLRRKYGGGGGEPESKDIAAITTEDGNVTVTARILTAGKRSIRYQGEEQVITEGTLADASGIIDFTAWEEFGLSPGDTITAGNAGVREWEGEPELNLGESTTLVFEDESLEVPHEIGGETDLVDATPGDRGLTVEARVIDLETQTIDGRDGETEILSGTLADESTRLPFTDWEPRSGIEEGADLRFENVYVREFRGVPSINCSEFTTVLALDQPIDVTEEAPRSPIGEAVAGGGAFDIELVGTVVAIRDGSGLIQRCPECGRVVQKGQCRSHGEVDAEDDLRVKAILDDGTGTVTAILGTELTRGVYGGDIEDAREQAREAMDQEVVADSIREDLVGREFRVRGSLSVDDYGANLNASEFEAVTESPAARAESLLREVEP